MPTELRLWLICGFGCLAISVSIAFIFSGIAPHATPGDISGMRRFGFLMGFFVGTTAPPILILGRSLSAAKSTRDIYNPLLLHAAISLPSVFLIGMLPILFVYPIFLVYRMLRKAR